MSAFSADQMRELSQLVNSRLKHTRHENDDHLDAGLLPQKIALRAGSIAVGGANGQGLGLPVGATGYSVVADSSATPGVKWVPQDGVSAWATIANAALSIAPSEPTNWVAGGAGAGANESVNIAPGVLIPYDPADYAAPAGRTLQTRLVTTMITNGTDPLLSSAIGCRVRQPTGIGGGAGVITGTGIVDALGLTYGSTEVAANLSGLRKSATSTSMAAGSFYFTATNNASTQAGSMVWIGFLFQYRHV